MDKKAQLTLQMVLENGIFNFDYAFDLSGQTDDANHSEWSAGLRFGFASRPAKVTGDTSCLASPQLKGCTKVQTQLKSLATI